ncbi:uncharacterized protein LOC127287802 [Leptopilina boulardi]|uniref:uncharacterized protein LOC127287802 n=1 Tax=Leptopilina boulardi TaxID=63433 RepID=UPI0021F557B1|nr:uncharacterized protein LOC127287802 [Leptopilina boulardi]
MSIKIFTFILILYSVKEFRCQVPSNTDDFMNCEFAKTLIKLANIFENKTEESFMEAKKLLNSETIDIKVQCRMNRNLYNVDIKRKDYENTLQKMLKKGVNSLLANDAKELWCSIASFFQEISNCYPHDFFLGKLSIQNIIYNMMSIITKEIVNRFNFFIINGQQLKNATSSHECQLRQDKRKLLFFQELLMQMSPIIGTCGDSIVQRECMLNKFKELNPHLKKQLKVMMSPIGSENLCKDL